MRIKQKNSLADYIFYKNIMVVVCLSALVIFFIGVFSEILIQRDINQELSHYCDLYKNEIYIENGKVNIPEMVNHLNPGEIVPVIVDDQKQIIYGEYPENGFSDFPFMHGITKKVYIGKTSYFIHDQRLEMTDKVTSKKQSFFIRSIIETSKLNDIFEVIRKVKYLSTILILIGCICAMYLVTQSMKKPLNKICEAANRISHNTELSNPITIKDGMLDEIKVLVNAYNAMLLQAQELVEVQKQFSSDVAHELKTPVSVIIAECQYSSKYLTDDDDVKEAFGVIEEQARKTNQIINNLLELTRLEKNQFKMNFQYLDLSEIVHSVCDSESLIDKKNITIHKDIKMCYANVDLNLILMAIRNIVNNAVKYSEENSEIFVSTDMEDDKIIIQCDDYGCGMDEETQKHIFNRFYRADSSRNSEGLGLGMAITKKIIELHQGTIIVESQLGQGCTVRIELPK